VEVYAVTEESARAEALRVVERSVFGHDGETAGPTYRLSDHEAVRHVCRVASGLDSFVVGEHEISGQVQRALRDAQRASVDSSVLESVAALARRASRRVRSETQIGRYAASVSSVAVGIVRERLGDLSERGALVVGAGEAALLVARALRDTGVGSLTVLNRSAERAAQVAATVGGAVEGLERLSDLMVEADVVLSATGADGVVLDVDTVQAAVARRGPGRPPLVVLDLAIPGDVDADVSGLSGVQLLTLEDVRAQVHRHVSLRRDEVGAAERVVDEVVDDFVRRQDAPDVDGFIGTLRRSIEEVRAAEVGRFMERRDPDEPLRREELDHLTRSIVNKLLHEPMQRLRTSPPRGTVGRLVLGAARELVEQESKRREEASRE